MKLAEKSVRAGILSLYSVFIFAPIMFIITLSIILTLGMLDSVFFVGVFVCVLTIITSGFSKAYQNVAKENGIETDDFYRVSVESALNEFIKNGTTIPDDIQKCRVGNRRFREIDKEQKQIKKLILKGNKEKAISLKKSYDLKYGEILYDIEM